jgi:AcrR family transcriptional regulator
LTGKALQQDSERERIRRAVFDLSLERGLAGLPLEDVLARAGCDRDAFEVNYTDLEHCFCELLQEMADEYVERVRSAARAQSGWRNEIRAAAWEITHFFLTDQRRSLFMMVAMLTAGERADLIRFQAMNEMISLIDRGRQELDDPDSLTRATAEGIAGTVYIQLQQVVATGRNNQEVAKKLIPELMHTVVLPYCGEDAAREELSIRVPRLNAATP